MLQNCILASVKDISASQLLHGIQIEVEIQIQAVVIIQLICLEIIGGLAKIQEIMLTLADIKDMALNLLIKQKGNRIVHKFGKNR